MSKSRELTEREKQDLTLYFVSKRAKNLLGDVENDPEYPQHSKTTRRQGSFFIEQDGVDFYCSGNLIRFNKPSSINAKVFRAIFKHADARGLATYEAINKELEKNSEKQLSDRSKIVQRIRNAVFNLFRYSNLPEKIPSGEKFLETDRGKGIILRNPKIK